VVPRPRHSFATASEASEIGLSHARRAGAVQEEARLVDEICTALLFGPAPAEEAIARCETLLAESRESRLTSANVSSSVAGLKAMRGEFAEARARLAVARRVYADLGLRFAIAGLAQIEGTVESLAGDDEAAERALREGYDILAAVGARAVLAAGLAQALVVQGDFAEARTYVTIAEEASGGDIGPQIIWRSAKARILSSESSHEEAVELATSAVTLAEQTDAVTMIGDAQLALSQVLHAAGRKEEARTAAKGALDHYARKGHGVGESAAEALLDMVGAQAREGGLG
jgi:tetratricopeptide (TPR) repeat protein